MAIDLDYILVVDLDYDVFDQCHRHYRYYHLAHVDWAAAFLKLAIVIA